MTTLLPYRNFGILASITCSFGQSLHGRQKQRPALRLFGIHFDESSGYFAPAPTIGVSGYPEFRGCDAHLRGARHDRLAKHILHINIDVSADQLFLDHVRALIRANRPPAFGAEFVVYVLTNCNIDHVK